MSYIYFIAFFLSFANCFLTVGCAQVTENNVNSVIITKETYQIKDELKKIIFLLGKFHSEKKEEQEKAQKEIIELSVQSNSFRRLAIEEMLKIVESQNTSIIQCENNCYQAWRLSVETLGTMNATEAIDPLVKRLEYNNGAFGLSLSWFPAAKSIVRIGTPAIPKLTEIFSEEENNEVRRDLAVHSLYEIGGDEAKISLQNILKKEINEERKEEIYRLLANWSDEKGKEGI